MIRRCLYVCAILLLGASSLWAHGTQIQITNTGNKIVTREALTDIYTPAISNPIRVYQMPLRLDVGGQTFTYPTATQPLANSGPGFAFGTGGFLDTATISLNLLDGLRVWNGSSFVDPGLEQINVFRGSVTAAIPTIQMTTTDGGTANIVVSAPPAVPTGLEYVGNTAHTSVRYRMLGDGALRTSIGDDGVYLLQFSLSSTQPGLSASDPFYFLLDKNAPLGDLSAASSFLLSSNGFSASQLQAIPEPGTLALCAGLIPLTYWSYRRKKSR